MEFVLPELLTRDDLLCILQKRQLNIPDDLPNDELLRIYKMYAIPLAKRDSKVVKNKQSPQKRLRDIPMDLDNEPSEAKKQMQFSPFEIKFEKEMCICEKRHLALLDDDSLTSATKRIKISWP